LLELIKVIVQPVVLERDGRGRIVGERLGEPQSLYSDEQLLEFMRLVREGIATENAQNGNRTQRRARKPKETTE
jgi:hypothetical protein